MTNDEDTPATSSHRELLLDDLKRIDDFANVRALRSYIFDSRGNEYHFAVIVRPLTGAPMVGIHPADCFMHRSGRHAKLRRDLVWAFDAKEALVKDEWYELKETPTLENVVIGFERMYHLCSDREPPRLTRPVMIDYAT